FGPDHRISQGEEPTIRKELVTKGSTFCHLNLCSIRNKINQLKQLLHEHPLTYFACTETKLDDSDSMNLYEINGYHSFRSDSGNKNSGGIIVYVREEMKCVNLD